MGIRAAAVALALVVAACSSHTTRPAAVATPNGKSAKFFISSDHADDVHARHGLTWVETPKSRLTIYANETDPAFFVRLAESVRRTN